VISINWLKGFGLWQDLKHKEIELRSVAIGMNSTIDFEKDVHIIMLDYDIKDISKVKESIKELQRFFNLSDAFIYSTRNGFHVFFWFDHIPYSRLRMIIDFAKYVDIKFRYISRFYDHKSIRVAGKYKERDIKFVEVILSSRKPEEKEIELGLMKLKEHAIMMSIYSGVFKKYGLGLEK